MLPLKNHGEGSTRKMIEDNSRWLRCPDCNAKTRTKVNEDTVLVHFPLYCNKCKKTINVNFGKLKMINNEIDKISPQKKCLYVR